MRQLALIYIILSFFLYGCLETQIVASTNIASDAKFINHTPEIDLVSPDLDHIINPSEKAQFHLTGTCSEANQMVAISGDVSTTTSCAEDNTWSAALNISNITKSKLDLTLTHTSIYLKTQTMNLKFSISAIELPKISVTQPAALSFINITQADSMTVTGLCSEAGHDVLITGDAYALVTCGNNLTWTSVLDFSNNNDGQVGIKVTHTGATQAASASTNLKLILDTTPPLVSITSPASGAVISTVNLNHFIVSGACTEPNLNVTLSGAVSSTVLCQSNNTWAADLNLSQVTDGAVLINVQQRDAAGNQSILAQTSFSKKTTLPSLAVTSPVSGSYINVSQVSSFTVSGTCSEINKVVVVSGSVVGTTNCLANQTWSLNLNFTSAPEGLNTLVIQHSDAYSNIKQIQQFYYKDTIDPLIAVVTPAPDSYINAGAVSQFPVTGTCSEAGQNLVISGQVSATTIKCSNSNTWSTNLNFNSISDGYVTVNFRSTDVAGNINSTASRFIKDTVAPTLVISSPVSGSHITVDHAASFSVSGTCSEVGQSVTIQGDASESVNCLNNLTWSADLNFQGAATGTVNITVAHKDRALNQISTTTSFYKEAVVQASPAAIAVTSPTSGSIINSSNVSAFSVSGSCSEVSKTVTVSGGTSGAVNCQADGTWATNINFSAASEGSITLLVSQINGARAASGTRTFFKDTTPASVAITAPASGSYVNASGLNNFSVSGTCSETDRSVIISGAAIGSVLCSNAKTWSIVLDVSTAPDGNINIIATHQDAAMNTTSSSSRTFIKDSVLPTLAYTSPDQNTYINSGFASAFQVTGSCSEVGKNIVISGAASATVSCLANSTWSANLNFSAASDGSVTISALHKDQANNAVSATRSFIKDTQNSTLSIVSPISGTTLVSRQISFLPLSGSCSEVGASISITNLTQTISGTATCAGDNTWTTDLNLLSLSNGSIELTAKLIDVASNTALSKVTVIKNFKAPSNTYVYPVLNNANWKLTIPVHAPSYWGTTAPTNQGQFATNFPNWSTIGSADITNPAAQNATLPSTEGVGSGNCNMLAKYSGAVSASASSIPLTSGSYNKSPYNNISTYYDEFYYGREDGSVIFRAPSLGWSTTQCSGSNHTRTEMRELYLDPAGTWTSCSNDWDSTVGGDLTGELKVESISTSASSVKPDGTINPNTQVTFAQIHGGGGNSCGGARPVFMLVVLRYISVGNYRVEFTAYTDTTGTKSSKFILASGVQLGDTINYGLTYRNNSIQTSISINGGAQKTATITEASATGDITSVSGTYPSVTNPAIILNNGEANSWYGQPVHASFGAYHAASVPNYSPQLYINSDETRVAYKSFAVRHPVSTLLQAGPSYLDTVDKSTQVTVNATSLSDAVTKANAASANTRIVLPAGTFTSSNLTITAAGGSNTRPIIIEGQSDGSTVLTGKVNFKVSGNYVLLKNLNFQNYDSNTYGSSGAIIRFDTCNYCGLYNSRMEVSVDPVMNASGTDAKHFKNIMIQPGSQSVEIGNNTFKSKKNQGSVVLINRVTNRTSVFEGHRIFNNLFTDRLLQGNDANDFDNIRIGDSTTSQTPSEVNAVQILASGSPQIVGNTVEFNVFENTRMADPSCTASNANTSPCSGEPEVISVKAPETIVRFNTFRNNSGGLTLRHGYLDVIEGNYFTGLNTPQSILSPQPKSYGIRVIGDSHLIFNNHMENLSATSTLLGGISILPGQPSAQNSGYWPVFDTIIAMNFLYKVSTRPISLSSDYGGRSKTILPTKIVLANSVISNGTQAFYNQAPNETYLSQFSFTNNFYDTMGLGLTTLAATQTTSASVSAITNSLSQNTGFNKPVGSVYVGASGILKTSTNLKNDLATSLASVSDVSAANKMKSLMPYLKLNSGSVYDNFLPLMPSQVGSSF